MSCPDSQRNRTEEEHLEDERSYTLEDREILANVSLFAAQAFVGINSCSAAGWVIT